MKALLVLTLFLAVPGAAWADQLQCNTVEVAERAIRYLPAGSLIIDYCSLCEAKAQVVKVDRVSVVKDCEHEVELGGPVLASTASVLKSGYETGARWVKAGAAFQSRLDLAYVYVEVAKNDFRWLGGELGLTADVKTKSIKLPEDLYVSFGAHPLAEIAAKNVTLPAPTPEMVRLVWNHHYSGQGKPPLLVEVVACLEVDNKKDSKTQYDCVQPVKGPVDKASTIYAWTSWLAPKGDEAKDITVQYLLDGAVRMTKDLPVSGASARTRAFTGAKLQKAGRWSLVIQQGGKEVGRVELIAQ